MPISKFITAAELSLLIPIYERVITKWCRLAVVAMLITLTVGILAGPAHAGVVYIQPSSDTLLFQSSQASYDWQGSDYDTYVWDNFTLSSTQVISGIKWRGIYVYGGITPYYPNPVTDFLVSIYATKVLGPGISEPDLRLDAQGNPHPLKRYRVRGNASETPVCVPPCYSTWHDYSFSLPTPFQATGGTEYWLQIEGIQKGVADWGIAAGTGGDSGTFVSEVNYAGGFTYFRLKSDAAFTLLNSVNIENEDYRIQYDGWKGTKNSLADGGSYRVSNAINNKVSFVFSGMAFKWVTMKGPDMGIAHVMIDKVNMPDVDLYNTTRIYKFAKSYSGLSSGSHTIVIQVSGQKNMNATNSKVVFDAITVGSVTTQDASYKVTYDTWVGKTTINASKGNYCMNGTAGAAAQLKFTGSQIDWITAKGPNYGQAEVFIDGVSQGVTDLYKPKAMWKVSVSFGGLSGGTHTIRVKVLGTKNQSSGGTAVVVDAFNIY